MFSNIINYKNHQSIDYYIYECKKENDFSAKIYGRLLAFIIAGREIFKFQTITLLGVGYGCKLIKKCLKQLSQINESLDVSDIIQHIIFNLYLFYIMVFIFLKILFIFNMYKSVFIIWKSVNKS